MTTSETTKFPRSGAEAQQMGMVAEYAAKMKETLLSLGQTEEQAETNRIAIIDRWS